MIAAGVVLAACGVRESVPAFRANDARFGRLGGSGEIPAAGAMCGHWVSVVAARDPHAMSHVSFPETNVDAACFTPVTHLGRSVRADPPPRGCAFPDDVARAKIETLAKTLELSATLSATKDKSEPTSLFPCSLMPDQRAAAHRQNARALRALAARTDAMPYAAIVVPGHGFAAQDDTVLAGYLPGSACRTFADGDLERLGGMPIRAARAADALRGGVAPIAIVSGGAIHSHIVEAFALMHLLECREKIPGEQILLEPCAEHTHTNLRNSGNWLNAIGGRAGYLVTDDHVQSDYFQDSSGFELLLGSIDQRSLRDWGYLVGAWRQASRGMNAGFWFTPYRFWSEPRDGLGGFTCDDGARTD